MDRYVIACNYRTGRNSVRAGAKAHLGPWWTGGEIERVQVTVLSRGGRRITLWERLDRLHNFRVQTVVDDHHPQHAFVFDTRDEAERELARWKTFHDRMVNGRPREFHDPGDEDRRPA